MVSGLSPWEPDGGCTLPDSPDPESSAPRRACKPPGHVAEAGRLKELGPLFGGSGAPRPDENAADWVKSLAGQILNLVPATGRDLEQLLAQIGLRFESQAGPA